MPVAGEHRVYQAIAELAVETTGAAGAALIGRVADELAVLATAGDHPLAEAPGPPQISGTSIGFVISSGQPMSLGAGCDGGGATLCLPCIGAAGVLGVLDVRGSGGEPFPPTVGRVAALIAEVAAAVLDEESFGLHASPAELGTELARLAQTDPRRYAAVASSLGALLAHGG